MCASTLTGYLLLAFLLLAIMTIICVILGFVRRNHKAISN